MEIAVVSYSFTGNNDALADAVAKLLSAEHVKITEPKARKTGAIIGDMLFNRVPKTLPAPDALAKYEKVLLIGPAWLGKAASPLRAYLKYIKANPRPYAFASISGGGLNPNPKLEDDVAGRAGAKPAAYVDLHIADLLPPDTKPGMEATSGYHLSSAEVEKLSGIIAETVKKAMQL